MAVKRLHYLGILLLGFFGLVSSSPLHAQNLIGFTVLNSQFNFPIDIAINTNTNITYVVDFSGHSVHVFDIDETPIATLGDDKPGFEDGQFYWPTAIALDSSDNLYIADLSGRIQVFDPSLNFLRKVTPSDPQNSGITDIAIGPDDELYATYPDTNTIRVYDTTDNTLPEIGSYQPGPTAGGITPLKIAVAADGSKYIVDDVNSTFYVRIYDENWTYVTSIGSSVSNPNYAWEFFVAPFLDILPDGYLYISYHGNNRVWKMDGIPYSDTTYGSFGNGTVGWGSNQFMNPGGVAMGPTGKVYIVDSVNRRIQVFNSDQTFSHNFGTSAGLSYQLADPAAVSVSPSGQLYVADTEHSRVQIYNNDGSYADTIGTSEPGVGNNQLDQPYDVAIAPDGRIFVVDSFNQRIQIFNTDHNYLATLGTGTKGAANDQFNGPLGIDIDTNGQIYVADSFNHRIQIFDSNLSYLATLGTGEIGNGNYQFKRPADVAVGPSGDIYVADSYNHRVQVYDSNLSYVGTIGLGTPGPYNDQFNDPEGIDVDAGGFIYVVDKNNNRIQVFNTDLGYSTTIGTRFPGKNETRLAQPQNIAVDNLNSYLYVADTTNNRIQLFPLINSITGAQDDTYTIDAGEELIVESPGILTNDNLSIQPLTATLINGPTHALTFTLFADGGFSYTPEEGFSGEDGFTYQNKNAYAASNWAQVVINVTEPEEEIEETETLTPSPNDTATPTPDQSETPAPTDTDTSTPEPTDEPEECFVPIETNPLLAPQELKVIPNQGRPTITWRHDTNLEWINIWIGNAVGTVHFEWYPVDPADEFRDINLPNVLCECGTCSVLPDINPLAGRYQVWMQGWGKGNFAIGGPLVEAPAWSGPNELRLPSIPPGPITPTTPTVDANGKINFHWEGVENATWYNVWIGTGAPNWQPFVFNWVVSNELNCINAEICQLDTGSRFFDGTTFDLTLPPGNYVWYVRSWGPGGFSTGGLPDAPEWAEGYPFTIP